MIKRIGSMLIFFISIGIYAQSTIQQKEIIDKMQDEIQNNSHIEQLAFELLDEIGPRLVGSPAMIQANEWAVNRFKACGIEANNEAFGTWKSWQRGITHVDMIAPRAKTLEATQWAWSPATKKPVQADVVLFPEIDNEGQFQNWLKNIKGKVVLLSPYRISGRPDAQIKQFATQEVYEKLKAEQKHLDDLFKEHLSNTGFSYSEIIKEIEKADAAAIVVCTWSGALGSNRVFGARTQKIPFIEMSLEDYGMLYRLTQRGKAPTLKLDVQSKILPEAKNFNTIAIIPGKELPEEYVILSSHLDSWDGGQGATDNGTGVLTMMEAARVLKKHYQNNKRTILIGLWGGEEQGLNGSRAFVEDHPEMVKNTQVVFNLDSGTGKINRIGGEGFLHTYDFLSRWIQSIPKEVQADITLDVPGMPGSGGSDQASFVAAGIPAFYLNAVNWDYGSYTWHTNRDTYDKIIFDDIKNNALIIAAMTLMASEDDRLNKEKRVLPKDNEGVQRQWPVPKSPMRSSDM